MIGEREFFELWKRVVAGSYKDAAGMPALTSKDFDKPKKAKIVKSAGAKWTRLFIGFPTHIATPDGRQIDYINGGNPGDLSADASKPWYSSTTGSAKLWTPGEWHVKTPLIGGDVEGTFAPLVMRAAPSGFDSQSITDPGLIGPLGNSPTGGSVDVVRFGGTVQTGADLGALVTPLAALLAKISALETPVTFADPVDVTVGAADTALLALNANRRGLAVYNSHATQSASIGKKNPMTFATGLFILGPGEFKYFGPNDLFTTAALRAFASGAGTHVFVSEGT